MAGTADLPVEGEKDGIVYKVAEIRHLEDALKLFREDFQKREPLLLAAGPRNGGRKNEINSDSTDSIKSFIVELLEGGLSMVAIDGITNQVIGLRTSRICTKQEKENKKKSDGVAEPKSAEEEGERRLGSVFTYLDDLKNTDFFGRYGVDRMLEFVFLVVKESYSKRGIATELLNRSLQLARQHGLEAVVVTATNPITIVMFEKLGFEGLRDLSVENYVINGEKAFPSAFSGQFGRLYTKRL